MRNIFSLLIVSVFVGDLVFAQNTTCAPCTLARVVTEDAGWYWSTTILSIIIVATVTGLGVAYSYNPNVFKDIRARGYRLFHRDNKVEPVPLDPMDPDSAQTQLLWTSNDRRYITVPIIKP